MRVIIRDTIRFFSYIVESEDECLGELDRLVYREVVASNGVIVIGAMIGEPI